MSSNANDETTRKEPRPIKVIEARAAAPTAAIATFVASCNDVDEFVRRFHAFVSGGDLLLPEHSALTVGQDATLVITLPHPGAPVLRGRGVTAQMLDQTRGSIASRAVRFALHEVDRASSATLQRLQQVSQRYHRITGSTTLPPLEQLVQLLAPSARRTTSSSWRGVPVVEATRLDRVPPPVPRRTRTPLERPAQAQSSPPPAPVPVAPAVPPEPVAAAPIVVPPPRPRPLPPSLPKAAPTPHPAPPAAAFAPAALPKLAPLPTSVTAPHAQSAEPSGDPTVPAVELLEALTLWEPARARRMGLLAGAAAIACCVGFLGYRLIFGPTAAAPGPTLAQDFVAAEREPAAAAPRAAAPEPIPPAPQEIATTAQVRIETWPRGALLTLDRRHRLGRSPQVLTSPIGKWVRVTARLRGFKPRVQRIFVSDAAPVAIKLKLARH